MQMKTLKSVSMNLKKPVVVVCTSRVPKKIALLSSFKKASSFVPQWKPAFPKEKRKRITTTTTTAQLMVPLEDIHLYSLTSIDLFAFYATRSFLTAHAPLLFMYRGVFQLPWGVSAYLLLFVSVFKSIVELSFYTSPSPGF